MASLGSRPDRVRTLAAALCGAAVLLAGCTGDDGNGRDDVAGPPRPETIAPVDDPAVFGDMAAPVCGEGELRVAAEEAAGSPDTLRIGVLTERGGGAGPEAAQSMWDASVAFADWCNELGGIGGLRLELFDLDAGIAGVNSALRFACDGTFALVGGGHERDEQLLKGTDGADLHRCGLIDLPAFTSSQEKSDANGQVVAIPTPGGWAPVTWLADAAELQPEDLARWTVVWGQVPPPFLSERMAAEAAKDRLEVAAGAVRGIRVMSDQPFPLPDLRPAGTPAVDDWGPYVLGLVRSGARSFTWVGDSEDLVGFMEAARAAGWPGRAVLDVEHHDPTVAAAGDVLEGALVRSVVHPLEEADRWPGVADYLGLVRDRVPDGVVGVRGMQSMSAWLLFATAVRACGEAGDGVVDRTCVLTEAAAVRDWTGGGLHAPQDPARHDEAVPGTCSMLLEVRDGAFVRAYPQLGGDGDDVDGFHCPDGGVVEVPGGGDRGTVDPDRPI
jgi:hypothetical protein